MVERGRWKNLEYIDRICMKCNDVEDEYHIVMICQKYTDLRKKYLPTKLYEKPSMYKFIEYLNKEDLDSLKNLGLFMYNVCKRYENEEIFA